MNEQFIKKSKTIYGNKYIYDKVDYKGFHYPIIIICKIHGKFKQTPRNHFRNGGCLQCVKINKLKIFFLEYNG